MNEKSSLLAEFEGVVSGHRDGHGFVVRDDGQPDIYLPSNEMRAVLHKDRVKARIVRLDRKGRPEGAVTEIIERSDAPHHRPPAAGKRRLAGGPRRQALRAGRADSQGRDRLGQARAGGGGRTDRAAGAVWPAGGARQGSAGRDRRPGMEIEIAVRKYGVPHEFSDLPGAGAGLARQGAPADKKHRVDLRDVPLVTIDGEDARDFDDAVYCEPAKVGRGKGWRLLVAIADVSHYVQTGSPSMSMPTTAPRRSISRAG
jgi:ribonuclease R